MLVLSQLAAFTRLEPQKIKANSKENMKLDRMSLIYAKLSDSHSINLTSGARKSLIRIEETNV